MNSQIILDYIIKNKNTDNFSVDNLFIYLKKYNLEFLLPDILKKIKKYNLRENKLNKVKVETPYKLDTQNKNSLEEKYNLKIEKEIINKDIITGYKLYTREKIIDASIDTLLKKLIVKS